MKPKVDSLQKLILCKKVNKIDKSLARWTKKQKTQIAKIKSESGDNTPKSTEIKRITRENYEQFYVNQLYNTHKMDKSLEKQNLPRLHHTQKEQSEKDQP